MSEASLLHRVTHPRRMKKVLEALREAQLPLTARDLSAICDLTSFTVAWYLRVLKNYGYPITMIHRTTPNITYYRLAAEPATQRG